MQSTVLTINNVSKEYVSKSRVVPALRNISFSLQSGEVFALLGSNGAGKTTLSSILATVMLPSSGDIHFVTKKNRRAR